VAVHKTPDAVSLQGGLGPIKRSLALVARFTRSADPEEIRRTALACVLTTGSFGMGFTPSQNSSWSLSSQTQALFLSAG